jgi:MFS transporter, Spinster family, sphingosine-1-phosphate transporter
MAEDTSGRSSPQPRIAVFALVLLTATNLLNHLDQRALTAIFPLLQAEWNLSDTQLGLVATIYTLTRTLAALPAGWLADRYGRVRILRWSPRYQAG